MNYSTAGLVWTFVLRGRIWDIRVRYGREGQGGLNSLPFLLTADFGFQSDKERCYLRF